MPFSRFLHREYAVLIGLSASYSPPMGRFLRITHPSATISSSPCGNKEIVLLACLRHAASVHPEPGSNSQKNFSIPLLEVQEVYMTHKNTVHVKGPDPKAKPIVLYPFICVKLPVPYLDQAPIANPVQFVSLRPPPNPTSYL